MPSIYIPLNSGLYFYAGPGVSYTFRNREYYDNTETITDKSEYNYINISAIAGLQYMFNPAVALGLETGLMYRITKYVNFDYTSGSVTGEDNTIDFDYYLITPRIGLTIYFN